MHDPDHPPAIPPNTSITEVMLPLRKQGSKKGGIPYIQSENERRIKKILADEEKNFLAIVDRNMILQKIAFLQKFNTILIQSLSSNFQLK